MEVSGHLEAPISLNGRLGGPWNRSGSGDGEKSPCWHSNPGCPANNLVSTTNNNDYYYFNNNGKLGTALNRKQEVNNLPGKNVSESILRNKYEEARINLTQCCIYTWRNK
jgi:hypothetical protein